MLFWKFSTYAYENTYKEHKTFPLTNFISHCIKIRCDVQKSLEETSCFYHAVTGKVFSDGSLPLEPYTLIKTILECGPYTISVKIKLLLRVQVPNTVLDI